MRGSCIPRSHVHNTHTSPKATTTFQSIELTMGQGLSTLASPLALGISLICAVQGIIFLTRLCLAYSVSHVLHPFYLQTRHCPNKIQADLHLAQKHNCQLPPELKKQWPLGIDRLKQIWDANSEGRLLKFFCGIAKDFEPFNNSYQLFLVGPRTFHILDPKNVSTILSTNFTGLCPD